MAGKTLNIEVEDRLIKVCHVLRKKKGSQLLDCFMFQTPPGAVTDGVIDQPEELALALREQLAAHGLAGVKNAVFAVSSSKIASREVKLPSVKEAQLKKAVEANAADYFPVDLTGYHVTYSLLERVSVPEKHARVLVLAAPLALLDGYFRVAEICGLSVKAVDAAGNGHYQALRHNAGPGVTMYVDVDCTGSSVSFIKDGLLMLQRVFAFGGDDLVIDYMRSAGMEPTEYVEALRRLSVNQRELVTAGGPQLTQEDVESSLGRLAGSIARSVDYFNSNHWEAVTQRIVLMGPCAELVGLRELVAGTTGLPTECLTDVPGVTSAQLFADSPGAYISCLGAGLVPVDLMPPRMKNRGRTVVKKEETMTAGVIICLMLVLGAAALSALAIMESLLADRELAATQREIESLQYAEDIFNSYLSYQQGQAAVDIISALTDQPNARLAAFYEELEEKMPSSILVLSAVCTNEGVSMNVTVGSYTDAAAALTQLRSFDSLTSVEVGSVSRQTNEAGIQRVSFSLSCTYGENPYMNNINPYGSLILPEETDTPSAG